MYDFNGKLLKTCKKGTPEEDNCFERGTRPGAYFTDNGAHKYCSVFYDHEKNKAGAKCIDEKTEKVTITTPAIYPQLNTRVFDKYVFVEEFDGFKYIDEKGKVKLDIKDKNIITVRDFSDGLAAVRKIYPEKRGKKQGIIDDGTRWGYMNKKGEIVIPTIYKTAQDFKDGVAKVRLPNDKEPRYIDKTGNYVIKEQ